MKNIFIILSLLFMPVCFANAQESYKEFTDMIKGFGGDTKKWESYLKKWEKESPDNAEMLECWFTHHIEEAKKYFEPSDDLGKVTDTPMLPDTITRFGKLSVTNIRLMKDKGKGMKHYKKAFEYIDKAIRLHPDILDLYASKTLGFIEKNEFKYAASTLLDVLQMDRENPNRWTNINGIPATEKHYDGVLLKDYYINTLEALMDNQELELSRIINDTLISVYPDTLDYKIYKAVSYMLFMNYDNALQYSLNLLEQFPDNANLLGIITNVYLIKEDKENTKKYATLMTENTDLSCAFKGFTILNSLDSFTIDYQKIEEWYKKNPAEYNSLEQRFISCDMSLTYDEIAKVYFGHALTDKFSGTTLWPVKLDSLATNNYIKECNEESAKCLKQHPASIAALTYFYSSGMYLNNTEADIQIDPKEIENALIRCNMLTNMIRTDVQNKFKEDEHKIYSIMWREDENCFVDNLMEKKEKEQTLLFSNPPYLFFKK